MYVIGHQSSSGRLLAFQSTVEGGFGRALKYDEGAILELAALEAADEDPHPSVTPPAPTGATSEFVRLAELNDNNAPNGVSTAHEEPNNTSVPRGKKRFTHFPFKRRAGLLQHQIAGPALPVVDADVASPTTNVAENEGSSSDDLHREKDEKGIKVVIDIEALDDEGSVLTSPNSQLTYLHIVRMGAAPIDEEDIRPWMVKVVKREAKIGSHSFHLHEIYGLSSTTSTTQIPTAEHSYPPTDYSNEEQTSECLLCLSSPREVVLLPCRHLVACRECAINMVEFGAGGTLVHTETEASPSTGDQVNNSGAGNTETNSATGNLAPVPPTIPSRRKRKAKGWFCPVCRQRELFGLMCNINFDALYASVHVPSSHNCYPSRERWHC